MKCKRLLSALLTLSMLFSLCVTTAFASDGPAIVRARLINDRDIEIYWDQDVTGGSNPSNFQVLVNGRKAALAQYGNVYFDQMTTLRLAAPVNESDPPSITVTATGGVTNGSGQACAQTEPVNVPYEPYYTQFLTTDTGILIKASPKADAAALPQAKAILDIMLSKDSAMAQRMADAQCCLGIYGKGEHAFYIPEHRDSYNPESLYVEGFGGTFIATIKDANVLRLLDGDYTTGYRDECILVHEFAHTVKNYGLTTQQQNAFEEIYNASIQSGKWANSYAGSNSHEFFATLSAIWFNVMNDTYDGQWDGVRGPINTRDELCAYDKAAYDFMAGIYPAASLPSPWDSVPNQVDVSGTSSEEPDFSHKFKIITRAGTAGIESNGGSSEANATIDLWWDFSVDYPETAYYLSWTVVPQGNGLYKLLFNDSNMALTPVSGSDEESFAITIAESSDDAAQLWRLVPTDGSYVNIINQKSGFGISSANEETTDGTRLIQYRVIGKGTDYQQWKLVDMTTLEDLVLTSNVDATPLTNVIAQSQQIGRSKYTKTSLAALDAIVAEAQALLNQGADLQSKIDTAAYQVQSALSGLVLLGDGTSLQVLIGDAELVKAQLDQYEEAGKAAFLTALEEAKALLAGGNQTDSEIQAAYTALEAAMDALKRIEIPVETDTSRLAYALAQAQKYQLDAYIEANKQAFIDAKNNAETVLGNPSATQVQIDEAKNALFIAMTKLRLAANKANLNAVIEQAKALDLEQYTEESAQAVRAALAAAQEVAANQNLSAAQQAQADDAQNALTAAMNALIKAADAPVPTEPEAPSVPEVTEPEDQDYPAPDATVPTQPEAGEPASSEESQAEDADTVSTAIANPQKRSDSAPSAEASSPNVKTGDEPVAGILLVSALSALICFAFFQKKKA